MRTLSAAIVLLLLLAACKKHDSTPSLVGTWIRIQYTVGYTGQTFHPSKDTINALLLDPGGHYAEFWAGQLTDTGTYSFQNVVPVWSGDKNAVSALMLTTVQRTTYPVTSRALMISWTRDTLVLAENGIDANTYWYVRGAPLF